MRDGLILVGIVDLALCNAFTSCAATSNDLDSCTTVTYLTVLLCTKA